MTTFASRRVPSPRRTCSPTRQKGPISTPRASSAPGCTIALGWMLAEWAVSESRLVNGMRPRLHVEDRGVEAEEPRIRHHREGELARADELIVDLRLRAEAA